MLAREWAGFGVLILGSSAVIASQFVEPRLRMFNRTLGQLVGEAQRGALKIHSPVARTLDAVGLILCLASIYLLSTG